MICSYCREYWVPKPLEDVHWCWGAQHDDKDFGVRQTIIETVNHPPHYTFGKYEVIDVLEDWFPEEPHLWQVGKYIARAARKGDELEDLKKARWYLERKIKQLESK